MKPPIPDIAWYKAESTRLGLLPRCPFASAHTCPRYYQSLSLLGGAGCTSIPKAEDDALKAKWEKHPLWPATGEQATGILDFGEGPNTYSNFCPEVAYETFQLFATTLCRHVGELDRDMAASRLGKEGAAHDDPRWIWCGITPQHYSECPLYSPLTHGIGKIKSSSVSRSKPTKRVAGVKPSSRLSSPQSAKPKGLVFISYAHADLKWLTRLERHLKPLLHGSKIQAWSDKKIKTGDKWSEKIQEALTHAKAAVLLVSPHFLASDYIRHYELPRILKNEKGKGLKIFQIILSPCAFTEAKFECKDARGCKQTIKLSDFQAANPPSKTLAEMKGPEQDRLMLQVAQEIAQLDAPSEEKRPKPTIAKARQQNSPVQSPSVDAPLKNPQTGSKAPESRFSYLKRNFRTAQETAKRNACINNLRKIDAAKQQWALENRIKGKSAVPTAFALAPYLSQKSLFPECPLGGRYTIGSVGVSPTCSHPDHVLE